MLCPKSRDGELLPKVPATADRPSLRVCPQDGGWWIDGEDYREWQQATPAALPAEGLEEGPDTARFRVPPGDEKAGLCPECGRILSRVRVPVGDRGFYLERCATCNGIWCDRGEWEWLGVLGLTHHIPYLFSGRWQAQVREQKRLQQEKQTLIATLGQPLADRLLTVLAELETHPHREMALNYLWQSLRRENPREESG